MKKIILAAAGCMATWALSAQTVEEPDTVLNVENVTKVIVTESPAGLGLNIYGKEGDDDYQVSFRQDYGDGLRVKTHQEFDNPKLLKTGILGRRDRYPYIDVVMFRMVNFGFVEAEGAPAVMEVSMGKSYEIGMSNLISVEYNFSSGNLFGVGFGLNWTNYRMTGNNCFVKADGNVAVGQYPDDVEGRFSRLKIFSMRFPVYYIHYFRGVKLIGGSNLGVRLEASFNYNSHGSLKTAWVDADGRDATYKTNSIGQRKFTVDFTATLKILPWVGLYARYSPMEVLADGRGPSFRTFTTGICLGF